MSQSSRDGSLTEQRGGYCTDCQLKRGAQIPNGELSGVTVTLGECSGCKLRGYLVPDCDFNWPDGRKAIYD